MADTIVVVDLETTGLDPRSSGIVEIGAVAVREGEIVGEFSSLVWPGRENLRPHHREVLRISGITVEELLDAPRFADAMNFLFEWASALDLEPPMRCTSFNVAFDRPFIDAGGWGADYLKWQPCLMLRAQEVMGSRKWPKLGEAAMYCGITRPGVHRALADATTAALVMVQMEEGADG